MEQVYCLGIGLIIGFLCGYFINILKQTESVKEGFFSPV